jgi:hypothetical protein
MRQIIMVDLWISQEEMKTRIGALVSRIDAYQARMDSHHEIRAIIKASLGKTEAGMESGQERTEVEIKSNMKEMNARDFEANPEEIEAAVEHQEVPNEEAAMKTVRTWRSDLGTSNRPWDPRTL